jgi:murein L,D-transpeptidase YcbB/YkuD
MSGIRSDRFLAGAAVALFLTAPVGALAQEAASAAAEGAAIPSGSVLTATAGVAPAAPNLRTTVTDPAPAAIPARNPLAALDPADRAVAERIRNLLAAKPNAIFANEKELAAVEAFYQARNLAPLWLDKGLENTRAKAAIARLRNADTDGLDHRDYRIPGFASATTEALADAELTLTRSVLTYARHLQAGRMPHRMVREDNIGLPQRAPDPAVVLAAVAEAADAGQALEQFSPPHDHYHKLRAALAQLRGNSSSARDEIPAGRVLKFNSKQPMEDARVPLLRERLGVPGEAADLRYDEKLAEAVKEFQRDNGLPATGQLDARTVKSLNPTKDGRIETVIANMERWRWYRREIHPSRVEVNAPDFTLKVIHDGKQVWTTRIVIGKPSMPTPITAQQMDSITINPTWKVPPSIVRNEYLPAEAREPGTLARMGVRTSRVNGEVVMTMAPGGQNPLGRLRFNFFNRFTVFQHDTPDQYLFSHVVRAESHGCMRVQDPAKYAEILAGIARPEEKWTAEKIKSLYGSGTEHEISLGSGPIWIYLNYQTAFVDDAGKLQTRRDLYNLDSRTLNAIRNARATASAAPERKSEPVAAAPARAKPAPRRNVNRMEQAPAAQPWFLNPGQPTAARQQPARGATTTR